MKIWINLPVDPEDKGEGGVDRVVRAQREWFPRLGHEVVENPADADVLACHMHSSPGILRLNPEKAVVAHCHGLYWAGFKWENWTKKANVYVIDAIAGAEITTVPSEWVANAVRRHTSRETVVIPHGVDLEEWSPREPHESQYILWDKNREDAVCDPAAMNELAEMMPGRQFVSTFGTETKNVAITGALPYAQAKEIMLEASIYLATARETFGISVLQAMAAGVPVVGWKWGGQQDFVGAGGILVEPGNVGALEDAVRQVTAERPQWSQAAREQAEAVGDWKSHMEAYIATYERAIELARRDTPRVSIIVPAYGLDEFLPDTLDSVLGQVDQDWECIIVDDASPDNCGAIADYYAERDPRFRVIHNETNQYLAGARNTGIAAARGRYILPLDADDMITPTAVQVLADALDADRLLHVAYGDVFLVKEDGRTPIVHAGFEDRPGHFAWPKDFKFEWQSYERNMLPYSSMFRRRAWELTGGYRTRCRTAEDADFWLRLSSYGFRPAKVTTGDTLIYRDRDGSMSREEGPTEWSVWFPHGLRHRRRPPAGWIAGLDGGSFAPQGNSDHSDVPAFTPSAVAVVIPVGLGHEGIVRDAIDSVAAQTFEEWECIVVNDTGQDLGPLPQWVKVVETDAPASGVAVARNVGIAASSSQWFLPLDADDLLDPLSLETWVIVGDEHPNDILYSDFYEDPDEEGRFQVFETPDYEPRDLIRNGALHIVTALTPRAVWEELGGYPEDTAWEDWAFQIEAAAHGICSRRIARPLVTYRKHAGTRRHENFSEFDQSRADIQGRYGHYWDGGTLMACKSCPGGQNTTITGRVSRPGQPPPEGMELLEYHGAKGGGFTLKGVSGQRYRVQIKHPFYCRISDVPALLVQGYKRVQRPVLEDAPPTPVLTAPGRPVQPALAETTSAVKEDPTPDPEPVKCSGTKKDGSPCSANAADTDGRCRHHPKEAAVTA